MARTTARAKWAKSWHTPCPPAQASMAEVRTSVVPATYISWSRTQAHGEPGRVAGEWSASRSRATSDNRGSAGTCTVGASNSAKSSRTASRRISPQFKWE